VDTLIAPVLSALKENHANSKLEDVERAFLVAEKAHEGQLRKSGELYITHPVAVAKILAELGLNSETISLRSCMTPLKILRTHLKSYDEILAIRSLILLMVLLS
jgi:hypothetical protein